MNRTLLIACLVAVSWPAFVTAQESSAAFDAPVVFASDRERAHELIDFDGDGDLDVVGWFLIDNNLDRIAITIYENAGGKLDVLQTYSQDVPVRTPDLGSSASADFDGDGRGDYVGSIGDLLFGFRSNSGSPFNNRLMERTFPEDLEHLACGDFDGDGDPDVATIGATMVSFVQNLNGVSFAAPVSSNATGAMAAGDFLGDGRDELAVLDGNQLTFFELVSGVFSATVTHVLPISSTFPPTIGDVDSDGITDIVVFSPTHSCLLRGSSSGFVIEAPLPGGPADRLVDVNQDGFLDGVCCGGSSGAGGAVINGITSTFRIALNDGNGGFTNAFTIRGLGATRLAGAADMDADGDIDLVAGRTIYYSEGPLQSHHVFGNGRSTRDMLVDIDGDGDVDRLGSGGLVESNDGNGRFDAMDLMPSFPPGTFLGMFSADFNQDGAGDLLSLKRIFVGGVVTSQRVSMLEGNGNGGFIDAGHVAPQGDSMTANGQFLDREGSAAVDVDSDGDLDFFAGSTDDRSTLWINSGTGAFTKAYTIPGHVQFGEDFDADGHVDLLMDAGVIRFGLGNLAFDVPRFISGPITQQIQRGRLAMIDFDDDGDMDIVGAHDFDEVIEFYRNDGQRNFTRLVGPDLLPGLGNITSDYVEVADLNGDGSLDIVVGGMTRSPGAVTIHHGIPGPFSATAFEEPIMQVLGEGFVVDVDGDGDLDWMGEAIHNNRLWSEEAGGGCRQYGHSTPGLGGFSPLLSATGPFRAGENLTLRLGGGRGGQPVFVAFGTARVDSPGQPLPSLHLFAQPQVAPLFTMDGAVDVAGAGTLEVTAAILPFFAGLDFFHQAFCLDLSVPDLFTQSQGLEVRYR